MTAPFRCKSDTRLERALGLDSLTEAAVFVRVGIENVLFV